MLFTSYEFLGFMAVLLVLYYLIPKKWQWSLLLAASYIFYLTAGYHFLSYVLITTVTTYLNIKIRVWGRSVTSTIYVKDTVAPKVTTKNVTIYQIGTENIRESVEPQEFIERIEDKTATTVRFQEIPDCKVEGQQTVVLLVEDAGGNRTKAEAVMDVVFDREPPQIHGVKKLTMTVGGNISYKKGITVTDNFDENVELIVDASQVSTDKEGTYTIIYTARDSSGNEAMVSTTLQVKPIAVQTITSQNIDEAADKILASIITETMSQKEKAKKIYSWCYNNIGYSESTPKVSYEDAAYRGLVKRRGDCYTYAMTAKCLLTRAGIKNMDIERIYDGVFRHYWNLIDIGEGWHHFDTCRRADGATFFYKTDAEIKAYSDAHRGTHNYDKALYPTIQ